MFKSMIYFFTCRDFACCRRYRQRRRLARAAENEETEKEDDNYNSAIALNDSEESQVT